MRQGIFSNQLANNKLKQNISESLAAIDEKHQAFIGRSVNKSVRKVNYQDYSCDYRNYYCNCGGLAAIKIMADDELVFHNGGILGLFSQQKV